MAQQALTLQLLISAPTDVPKEDLALVQRTVTQWNVTYGRAVGLAVLPVSWSDHAVSEFGQRPQGIINEQLVDDADMVLALLADRLGTPTGEADSGTVEEIQRVSDAGKPVAILRSTRPRPPADDTGQAQRLSDWLKGIRDRALVLNYAGDGELIQHVNNMLSRQAGRFQQGVETALASQSDATADDDARGVWPRIEVSESLRTDSKGQARTETKWHLVLENTTGRPVHQVSFVFEGIEETDLFNAIGADEPIATMAPGGSHRFPLLLAWGSPNTAECVVTWSDQNGEHTTRATVRT